MLVEFLSVDRDTSFCRLEHLQDILEHFIKDYLSRSGERKGAHNFLDQTGTIKFFDGENTVQEIS